MIVQDAGDDGSDNSNCMVDRYVVTIDSYVRHPCFDNPRRTQSVVSPILKMIHIAKTIKKRPDLSAAEQVASEGAGESSACSCMQAPPAHPTCITKMYLGG